jgi:hypothetical protein
MFFVAEHVCGVRTEHRLCEGLQEISRVRCLRKFHPSSQAGTRDGTLQRYPPLPPTHLNSHYLVPRVTLLPLFLLLPLMISGSLPALLPCHLLSSTQTTILESVTPAYPLFQTLSIPLLSLVFNRLFANWVIAIYAPMINTPVHNVLDACISITRAGGRGWALEIESFFGPVKWHRADRRVPFGAQKPLSPSTYSTLT